MATNDKRSNFPQPWVHTISCSLVGSFSNLLHQASPNILRTILELHALRDSDPILRDFRTFIGPLDNHGAPLQHKQAIRSIECESSAVRIDPRRSKLHHAHPTTPSCSEAKQGGTNLGPHGDLDGVGEVVDALQHGGAGADAEGHLLRRIPARPQPLRLPAAAPREMLTQRRGGSRNGRCCRPVHGRARVCGGSCAELRIRVAPFGVGRRVLEEQGFGFWKLRLHRKIHRP